MDRNGGMLFLIEFDWIFIWKKGHEFWIACLIVFDLTFVKGSYRENLIEIHRNSGEKLIWLKLIDFSGARGTFPIEISIHSDRLSIQIYGQKTDLKVLNIFSIKIYQLFPAGMLKSMWNTMECERDSSSGALGGARETHWERISHALKCFKGTC